LTITGSLKLHTFEHEEVLFQTTDQGMVRNNEEKAGESTHPSTSKRHVSIWYY